MKVGRWKVIGLGSALAIGFVSVAEAAQIRVTNDTFADFGLNMKIWYRSLDKRGNATDTTYPGWSRKEFSVGQGKIYFSGQVTKLFKFYGEFDQERTTHQLGEAAIGLKPAKEFNIMAGLVRKPFTRYQIVSGYALLMPTDYFVDPQGMFSPILGQLSKTDTGIVAHGDLAGGVLTYRIGLFNEDRSATNKVLFFGGYEALRTTLTYNANSTNETTRWVVTFTPRPWWTPLTAGKLSDKKNFEIAARVEFQPIMLGFKPESAATTTAKTADTRLGARDMLIIGLGYNKEKHTPKLNTIVYYDTFDNGVNYNRTSIPVGAKSLDRTAWTADFLFEKKFGSVIPNIQAGHIEINESHLYYDSASKVFKKGDSRLWYLQGQLLFDQVAGIGKPAIAFRYSNIKADAEKDLKANTFGLALNYYIRGQAARISFGFDTTKYRGGAKNWLKYNIETIRISNLDDDPQFIDEKIHTKAKDRITDWYIYLQSQF